jgi:3-phenylpropionate/cinnamic acid dioxygenase small subunit
MDARSGVENTLYRYAWAYDIGNIEELAECFTLETESIFADSGIKSGRDAVVAEMRRRREKYTDGATPWHVISNVFITEQTQAAAMVKSFYTFIEVRPGQPLAVRSLGYYDDQLVVQDGVWRIHRRRIVGIGSAR